MTFFSPAATISGFRPPARWSYLDLTDGPDAEQMHDLSLGVNWYWNPYARMMVNWIHSFINTPAQNKEADIIAITDAPGRPHAECVRPVAKPSDRSRVVP